MKKIKKELLNKNYERNQIILRNGWYYVKTDMKKKRYRNKPNILPSKPFEVYNLLSKNNSKRVTLTDWRSLPDHRKEIYEKIAKKNMCINEFSFREYVTRLKELDRCNFLGYHRLILFKEFGKDIFENLFPFVDYPLLDDTHMKHYKTEGRLVVFNDPLVYKDIFKDIKNVSNNNNNKRKNNLTNDSLFNEDFLKYIEDNFNNSEQKDNILVSDSLLDDVIQQLYPKLLQNKRRKIESEPSNKKERKDKIKSVRQEINSDETKSVRQKIKSTKVFFKKKNSDSKAEHLFNQIRQNTCEENFHSDGENVPSQIIEKKWEESSDSE